MPNKEIPLSTYTEANRRYYLRYKPLIHARRKKYDAAYKKWWYDKHKEEIKARRRAEYAEARIRRLVEREKILMAENRLKEAEETRNYLNSLGYNTQTIQALKNVTKSDTEK